MGLLKKLKAPSKLKKLRFFDSPSRCLRTNKTSNDDWLKRKKKSTTPDETVNELSNLCRPPWTLNPNPEPTPSDKLPMPPNRSRSFNLSSRTTLPNSMMQNDDAKTPLSRWLSSNDDPTCSLVKSKNSETLLNKLNEAENWLRPSSTSPTNDPTCSILKTLLLSTRNENWRLNSNKLKVKSKRPFLNAETLKRKPRRPSLMLLSWLRN